MHLINEQRSTILSLKEAHQLAIGDIIKGEGILGEDYDSKTSNLNMGKVVIVLDEFWGGGDIQKLLDHLVEAYKVGGLFREHGFEGPLPPLLVHFLVEWVGKDTVACPV